MTPDLSIAKVYLSVFAPGRDEEVVFRHIDDHIQQIRHKLAGRIKHQVRKIPELHFYVDDTSEYVNKMESLFKKVETQRKDADASEEEE
jgi:ribosome-binding factor A